MKVSETHEHEVSSTANVCTSAHAAHVDAADETNVQSASTVPASASPALAPASAPAPMRVTIPRPRTSSWSATLVCTNPRFDLGDQAILNVGISGYEGPLDTDIFRRFNFDDDGLLHPCGFSYRFYWFLDAGGLGANSGAFADKPAWGFIAPQEGRYLLAVDIMSPEHEIQTLSCWVCCGQEQSEGSLAAPARKSFTGDEPVVVQVDDVSQVFNRASEQYNSLKEYALALAKHELRFKEFRALDHVSFEVHKGEAFGLVGTNGSGKSTMLKIIAGVLKPSAGTCRVTGTIAPLIELGAGFDLELTAKENIYLNGSLLGYRREFIDEHYQDIVDFAELADFMDTPLKNFSSGMVARIAFAIATITEPDILIVDETLSVGDFLFQQKCERRIQELVESNNVTVLLVSHSIDLVERICTHAAWIEHGKLLRQGPAREVCAAYKNLER